MKPIETDDLTIHFDGKRCIHARRCVLGLPDVFVSDARPWIQAQNASTEDIVSVIESCPSGALSYERKAGESEVAPETNTVRLWENGPLEIKGDVRIEGQEPMHRALICRCGRTSNPPFCDNSHRDGFEATGLPGFNEGKDTDVSAADGPVEVSARPNSPVAVMGNVQVIAADGSKVASTEKAWFCRCGASGNKPFCDGSHGKIGFQKAGTAED